MKRNNIKTFLKNLSFISLIAFAILYILEGFFAIELSLGNGLREAFVLIYIIASLYYYRMELKDKNDEIQQLRHRLNSKK
jgi:hypothetical protein